MHILHIKREVIGSANHESNSFRSRRGKILKGIEISKNQHQKTKTHPITNQKSKGLDHIKEKV